MITHISKKQTECKLTFNERFCFPIDSRFSLCFTTQRSAARFCSLHYCWTIFFKKVPPFLHHLLKLKWCLFHIAIEQRYLDEMANEVRRVWSKRSNRFLEFRTIPSNTMDSSATDNQGCSKWRVFSFPFISFNLLNPIYWTKCSCGLKKRSGQSGLTTLRQSWGRAIYQTLYRELSNIVFYVHLTITTLFYSDHGEVKASGKEGVGNSGETYL